LISYYNMLPIFRRNDFWITIVYIAKIIRNWHEWMDSCWFNNDKKKGAHLEVALAYPGALAASEACVGPSSIVRVPLANSFNTCSRGASRAP